MKLIVGLGNPGNEYQNTRHNIGFMVIDNYAKIHNIKLNKKKFNGLYQELKYNDETIILLKPLSYMNLSGMIVLKYVKYYKVPIEDILIISDDLDLPFGKIKLKAKGSCGGHNGLRNIEEQLKTTDYKRLKIGISNNKKLATKDYVLGNLNEEEQLIINKVLNVTNSILDDFIDLNFEKVMSKYN